MNIGLVGWF